MDSGVLSLFVVYVPAIIVALLIQSRLPKKMRGFLITMGPAFLVAGICAYFGAEYYDLPVVGRSGHLEGRSAVNFGIICIFAGFVMTALHFALLRMFPQWMSRKVKKKRANKPVEPTSHSAPRCDSRLT